MLERMTRHSLPRRTGTPCNKNTFCLVCSMNNDKKSNDEVKFSVSRCLGIKALFHGGSKSCEDMMSRII
jgi:hypothetical protein